MGHLFFEGIVPAPKSRTAPLPVTRTLVGAEASAEVAEFLETIFAAVALPITQYRRTALQRRLPAALRFLRVPTLGEAIRKVRQQPELVVGLINVLLLGVTEFCRDEPVFAHLRDVIIPEWQLGGRAQRVWSAACSDGCELYSIALLLAEAGLLVDAQLLGTDCRASAIASARAGCFPVAALGILQVPWRREYFCATGAAHQIDARLRERVTWKQADLFEGPEPGPWDLVLWRNMAIYLEPAAAEKLWQAIVAELRLGAYVVAGKADHPPRGSLERVAACVYRKGRGL